MSKRRKKIFKEKINYPMIQGSLKEDSETILCGTGRYKTSFTLIDAKTQKEYLCVYWSNLKKILKGEFALVRGMQSAKDTERRSAKGQTLPSDPSAPAPALFFCADVRKIPYLYEFGEID